MDRQLQALGSLVIAAGIAPATVTLLLLVVFALGVALGVALGIALMVGRETGG